MPLLDLFKTCEGGLSLRLATREDASALLAWRNDPQTRKASRNTATVQPEEHRRWLAALLEDPERCLFIIMANGRPCGQVRLDTTTDGVELSWSIALEYRRRGYARQALSRIVRALPGETLTAWIRSENLGSIRTAEAAGFHLDETRASYLKYVVNPTKDARR